MTEELRLKALELMREQEATNEIHGMNNAIAWVVLLEDLDFGSRTVYGFFEDPVEALVWAEKFKRDLNLDLADDEKGWAADVYPLQPHD